MRRTIFSIITIGVGVFVYYAYDHLKEKVKEEPSEPVIAETCKWLGSIDWTEGEPPSDTFWVDGEMCFGSMPVRGAERTFDTVINHSHVYFMTKE